MFCEESLGKIKFRAFRNMSVHKFYRLRELITLEQVNATEWLKKRKKKNLFWQNWDAMVKCCKLSLYANESCHEHAVYFRR